MPGGAFFGMPAQDGPAVCLTPTIEFQYHHDAPHGWWNSEDAHAGNSDFVLWNPAFQVYSTTTTTTPANAANAMLAALALAASML